MVRFRPVAQQPAANPLPYGNAVAKSGCVFFRNGNRNPQRAPGDRTPPFCVPEGRKPFRTQKFVSVAGAYSPDLSEARLEIGAHLPRQWPIRSRFGPIHVRFKTYFNNVYLIVISNSVQALRNHIMATKKPADDAAGFWACRIMPGLSIKLYCPWVVDGDRYVSLVVLSGPGSG
jgi:hypothetical protein